MSSTWVESETVIQRTFALARRWAFAISASSAFARWPSRTTVSPPDDEPVGPEGAGEDDPGDQVVRTAELETVGAPDGEVGALAGLERADVVTTQHCRAAARAEADRLARRHRRAPVTPA